jgi:hypothetical protein
MEVEALYFGRCPNLKALLARLRERLASSVVAAASIWWR